MFENRIPAQPVTNGQLIVAAMLQLDVFLNLQFGMWHSVIDVELWYEAIEPQVLRYWATQAQRPRPRNTFLARVGVFVN